MVQARLANHIFINGSSCQQHNYFTSNYQKNKKPFNIEGKTQTIMSHGVSNTMAPYSCLCLKIKTRLIYKTKLKIVNIIDCLEHILPYELSGYQDIFHYCLMAISKTFSNKIK